MKNFLRKLKPTKFTDLVVALALFRPGPMENIDSFIRRKEGKEKIDYLVPSLESVLKETYGIIVYQEQIMKIFNIVGGYSVAEADLIRRAISKKKEEIILSEKDRFIEKAFKNGYEKSASEEIYNLILKFANYGFNKSHSVAYALVGYQMMYLKVKYPLYFYTSLLTINIGSSTKTKEYIDEAKQMNIKIMKPDINQSGYGYLINSGIIMPLSVIKNVGEASAKEIVLEREKGLYLDFFDFMARTYGKSVNTKTIENLIYGGAFDSFNETRGTLLNNIKSGTIYSELISGLDASLVTKPELEKVPELAASDLMNKELELFGFYVSNHPASKYHEIKINTISNYFDKNITTVGLLESVKTIKTKKGDSMAFLKISDETGSLDYTLFPNRIDYVNRIKKGDLLKILGHVEKRLDKYQIVINKVEVLKD
jgi:DNA polymerase-3 subunit alpha